MCMHHRFASFAEVLFKAEEKHFLVENVTRVSNDEELIGCDSKTEEHTESNFSAEEFVEQLLNGACQHPCDETSEAFNKNTDIPNFYNENLFRKGQEFFYKHIFSLFFSNFIGLLVVCCPPESLNILKMTNKSSTPMTAYKRYMATIFHMMTWYDSDFKPGSRSWSSLRKVRLMHNSASKQSNSEFKYRINQQFMSLTLFGFMGFGLVRSKMFGIHKATDEEWKGFIHLWRVIGYALGLENRFNICRDSVAETKQICDILIRRVFAPAMKKPGDDFYPMTKAMIEGLWAMNPVLQHEVFIQFTHMAMEDVADPGFTREYLPELSEQARRKLKFLLNVTWAMQYSLIRILLNFSQVLALWLMKVCPFLAFYKFGVDNSYVEI